MSDFRILGAIVTVFTMIFALAFSFSLLCDEPHVLDAAVNAALVCQVVGIVWIILMPFDRAFNAIERVLEWMVS